MGRVFGLISALVLVAACGSSSVAYEQSHSAQQIVRDAGSSTGSATSFHLAVDASTQDGPAKAEFDVSGTNAKGSISGQGMTVHLTHVDGKTYVNGTDLAAFLQQTNPQAAAIVKAKAGDKWVLMPSDFWSSTTLGSTIDLQKLSSCLQGAAGLTKKGTSTIASQRVIEVDDQLKGQLFVQTAAPHYFVRIALAGGDTCMTDSSVSSETIDLTQVGQKIEITAPTDSVDLQTLASG